MNSLSALRESIDAVDEQLLTLLAHRFELTAEVGQLKKQLGLPALDSAREAVQMQRFAELATRHGLPPDLVQQIMRLVIDEVVSRHRQI